MEAFENCADEARRVEEDREGVIPFPPFILFMEGCLLIKGVEERWLAELGERWLAELGDR